MTDACLVDHGLYKGPEIEKNDPSSVKITPIDVVFQISTMRLQGVLPVAALFITRPWPGLAAWPVEKVGCAQGKL